jgi:aminomethyltransferase
MLKQTPLFQLHKNLGAKLAPFGGWLMPIQYEGIIAEHNWARQSAALFDICHMGEFIIYGNAKSCGLENIITFDISNLPMGSCRYGFMLNENGGIIDDLIIYRLEQEKYMLVVNAAARDKDFEHIKKNLSTGITLEDISDRTAKLDLQGPLSRDILTRFLGPDILGLKYYHFTELTILSKQAIVSRTGYTGELGFEIYIDIEDAAELWNMLLKNAEIKPAGLGARDTLRLEMGFPLYGQDINESTTPLEAGLDRFVDLNKFFLGKDILLKQREEGLSRRLISFISDSRRSPRHNDKIISENREVGAVTSGSFSPSLGVGIGMGYVENGYDWLGLRIVVKNERTELLAQITDKPFYKSGSARK